MVKIKPDNTTLAGGSIFIGFAISIVSAYSIILSFYKHSSALPYDYIALILGLTLILGSIYGTYYLAKDKEIYRSEDFWPTHYPYDKIKKIYLMDHWYLGKILVINYLNSLGNEKTKRFLAMEMYKLSDVKLLLTEIHKNNPNIEIDVYCLGLINK